MNGPKTLWDNNIPIVTVKLGNEAKQGRIAGIINNIVVANQMSQNFDRQMGNDQNQGLQR